MKRTFLVAGLVAVAFAVGVGVGQSVCNSVACRDAIGVLFRRGHLLALVHGRGIYEATVQREIGDLSYAGSEEDVDLSNSKVKQAILSRLISEAVIEYLAKDDAVSEARVDRECDLVRFQFQDGNAWLRALATNHLSRRSLRSGIGAALRAEQWIERQLGNAISVSDSECAEYFDAHPQLYFIPARYCASHVFLAAPAKMPSSIVDQKRQTIDSLSLRMTEGESLSELVALTSEDEATKNRGGDLGFFSEARMPPDFFAAVAEMQVGQISAPIQTRLGFHIIELTDFKPARQLSFAEAKAEIRLKLANEKRPAAMQSLASNLIGRAEFVRSSVR